MLKRTVTWISTFSFRSPITNLVLVKGATSGTESLLLSEGSELAVARAEVGEERLFYHRAGLRGDPRPYYLGGNSPLDWFSWL